MPYYFEDGHFEGGRFVRDDDRARDLRDEYADELAEERHEAAQQRRRARHQFDPTCGCSICEPPDDEEADEQDDEETEE